MDRGPFGSADLMDIRRANERGRSERPGVTSMHCFSSGPYYDPHNVSFGPLVGVDEHTVEPDAGFDWHGHRGVCILSWVLDGALRHEDSDGAVRVVQPRELLVQHTGAGIRHRETNASDSAPLRFVQTTLLVDTSPGVGVQSPPLVLPGVSVAVHRGNVLLEPGQRSAHLFVTAGEFRTRDVVTLRAGDSVRLHAGEWLELDGDGEAVVVTVEA